MTTHPRGKHGFLHDEQGDRSYARLGLTWVLVFTGVVIIAALFGAKVPDPVWPLLGSIIGGFMLWAGGRAVARYLGPQLAGMVQGVASSKTQTYVADDELPRRMPPDPE